MSENIVVLCVSPISRHKWVQNITLGKFVVYQRDPWKCGKLYIISQNSSSTHAGKHIGHINNWGPLEYTQLGTTGLELLGMWHKRKVNGVVWVLCHNTMLVSGSIL